MKQKIIIMRTPVEMSDEEIRSFMNFDSLLRLREKKVQHQRSLGKIRKGFIGLAGLLLLPAIYFALTDQHPEVSSPGTNKGTQEALKQMKVPSAVPVDSAADDSLELTLQKKDPINSATSPKPEVETGVDPPVSAGEPSKREDRTENDPVGPVYVQAEPPHGYPLLYAYFDKNLMYPKDALKDSVEGTLNVAFVIDVTGNAVEITVENSPGPSFDREAIRLVENMPLWKPATYNGSPVKSKISLPITFDVRKIK